MEEKPGGCLSWRVDVLILLFCVSATALFAAGNEHLPLFLLSGGAIVVFSLLYSIVRDGGASLEAERNARAQLARERLLHQIETGEVVVVPVESADQFQITDDGEIEFVGNNRKGRAR